MTRAPETTLQQTSAVDLSDRSALPAIRGTLRPATAGRRWVGLRVPVWRLFLVLSFCIVLELTARVDEWVRYGMPLFTRVVAHDDLLVRDADGMHGRPY